MNTNTIVLFLVLGLAVAAVYVMTREDGAIALPLGGGEPPPAAMPEGAAYITAIGGLVGSTLGGVSNLIGSAYGAGGGSVGGGGGRK